MLYLVGSRLFGNHRDNSDYDFIGEHNQENLDYVKSLGLNKVESSKFIQFFGIHDGKVYDVVLHDNLWPRLMTRDYLMSLPEIKTLPKDERNKLMREVINFYEERQYVGL